MSEVLPTLREPSTQLERSLASVPDAVAFAEAIATTQFVPGGYRGKPDAILACFMLGHELGLGPMRALSWITMIDGRPTVYAEGLRALILARGHELKTIEWTKTRCVLAGRRAGASDWQEVTYTMDDAQTAGLKGKPSWRAYPMEMLLARATSRLSRLLFADVIGGLETAEEYADNGTGAVLPPHPQTAPEGEAAPASPPTRRRRRVSSPEPAAAAASSVESLPEAPPADPDQADRLDSLLGEHRLAEEQANEARLIAELEASGATLVDEATEKAATPELITPEQRAKLHALFGEKDVESREAKLAYATRVTGRKVESSNDLTVAEASKVIDVLEAWDYTGGGDPFAGLKPNPATDPFPEGY